MAGEVLTYDMSSAPCFSDRVVWKSLHSFTDLAVVEIGIAQQVITSDHKVPAHTLTHTFHYRSRFDFVLGEY